MKIKSFLILFAFTSCVCFSQSQPKKIAELFFKEFKEKSVTVALENLYQSNKWISSKNEAVVKLKSQLEDLNEAFVGKLHGHELMLEKKQTERIILLSYMAKYERQPIRFTFIFYKPNDKWIIYSFKFDGNIINEFEESTKHSTFKI